MTKSDDIPMNPVGRMQNAPRCHAKAKSTGERCKCPAVPGMACLSRAWRAWRTFGGTKSSEVGAWGAVARSRTCSTVAIILAPVSRLLSERAPSRAGKTVLALTKGPQRRSLGVRSRDQRTPANSLFEPH